MTERRPRIPDELAEKIQAVHPMVPFERLVRMALEEWEFRTTRRNTRKGMVDELVDDWIIEMSNASLKDFDALVAEARKRFKDSAA